MKVKLSKRQLEVVDLIASGDTSKQAAQKLGVSKRTIDFHLDKVYKKLNVKNRLQAIRVLTNLGVISIHPTAELERTKPGPVDLSRLPPKTPNC